MTEQQTPASVLERLRENLADSNPSRLVCVESGDLQSVLDAVERLSAEREGLREALADGRELVARWLAQSCEDDAVPELQAASRSHLAARAALTQGESRQTGWRLAPVEPTEAMMKAWNDYRHNASGVVAWEAMIAALPAAPTPAGGGGE